MFAFRQRAFSLRQQRFCRLAQEVYRKAHTLRVVVFDVQGARFPRPAAQDHRVVFLQDRRIGLRVQPEGYAFRFHQADPPFDGRLGQLHVRNAVHQQSAGPVRPLDYGHAVPEPVQQVRRRQAGGSAADDRAPLPCPLRRNPGSHPAFRETFFDQVQFVVPVGHSVIRQVARFFAQRGAYPSREFREGRRLQQPLQRFLLLSAAQQVVPFRNQVVQRASEVRLAEGHAAVHAAGSLADPFLPRLLRMQVLIVRKAFLHIPERVFLPAVFHKSGCRTHNKHLRCHQLNTKNQQLKTNN